MNPRIEQPVVEPKTNEQKISYQRPVFEAQTELLFPKEIWESFNNGNWCFGCTNCHGCN